MMLRSGKLVADHQAYLPVCTQRLRGLLKGLDRSLKSSLLEFVRRQCEGDATLPHGVEVNIHPQSPPPSAICLTCSTSQML